MTKSTQNLKLDTPWAIGESKYSKILQAVSAREIKQIVEFGSGRSTARLGKDFPDANIISIEHREQSYHQTMRLLTEHNVSNALVLHRPITRRHVGIRSYLTYDLNTHQLKDGIDFVLIDGPVESETLRGREAPLYMVFPLIKIGGLIVLDDYHRDSAKAVVRNWLNSYRDSLMVIKEYEGIIILEKCGDQREPSYPGLCSILDNCYTNAWLCTRALKRFMGSIIKVKG